jgi:hypothetical protein
MRRIIWVGLIFGLGLVLARTNPRQKGRYVNQVARNFQAICCEASTDPSQVSLCERLWPITTPVLQGVLHLYTDPPEDYILFTRYTTRLPGYTVYGLGIGGQFIVWPREPLTDNACEILRDTFLSRLGE